MSAAHTALAMVAAADGDRVRVERHYRDGLERTRQVGGTLQEVRLRSNHASHLVDEGRYHEALAELEVAGDLAELTGFAILRLLIASNRSDVRRRLGDLEAAEADAREAEELGRELGTDLVLHPQLALAELHRDRGDVSDGRVIGQWLLDNAAEAGEQEALRWRTGPEDWDQLTWAEVLDRSRRG